MKRIAVPRRSAFRHWTIPGVVLLFLFCAVMGGADPLERIESARTARAELEAASDLEGAGLGEMMESAAAAEPAETADVPAVEGPAAEAPAEPSGTEPVFAAEEGLDFVDYDSAADLDLEVESREEDGRNLITVALDDVSLEDTVRLFAQTTGANIIVSGALLEGLRVTVNLREVDWRPALRSILDIHGLDLIERTPDSGVFSIQPKRPDAPEPTQVETFFLDFITTGEIQVPVKNMLRPNAVLTTFPSRNAIVVRSTEANLGEVRALIEELDRPGRQVLIEAKIMELSDEAMKQLGIRWDALGELGIDANIQPFSYYQGEERNRTTTKNALQGGRTTYVNTGRDFRGQDGSRPATSGNNPDYVRDFFGTYDQYDAGGEVFAFSGTTDEADRSVLDVLTRTIIKEQSAILEMDTLSVVLSALENMDGVSVVSNPKMIVTSGSTNAFFSVGRRDPIIESELKRGTAESPGDIITSKLMDTKIRTSLIEGGYFRTGIDLQVVATVKTDDFIEASISPSLRRLIQFKEVGINSWPIISVKEIETTFTLRSGQTVAIGGLTDTEETKMTSRVPVLGHLPFIGRLFSHEKDVKKQVETIIFVTLSVADPGELAEHAGVPEDARLVHKRRLQDKVKREEYNREIRKLTEEQQAAAASEAVTADTAAVEEAAAEEAAGEEGSEEEAAEETP